MKECPSCGGQAPYSAARCKDCFHDFDESALAKKRRDGPIFLLAAGVAATLRWLLFPFADTLPAMAALQTLHGLSFGAAHLGAVAILARVVPSRWAGTGQGLLATSVGIQMAIGLSISGAIYEINPDWPFFVMSVVAAIGTLLTLAMTPMLRNRMAAE